MIAVGRFAACIGMAAAVVTPVSAVASDPASVSPLADTQWRLVEFQSMDDAHGTTRPSDPSRYTMRLDADGTVAMRLNCNRATGTWSATPSRDPSNGQFSFGPLAVTSALCPPPSMDESIAKQSQYIRGYLMKDGRLYLSLMADGGIYAWEPDTTSSSTSNVPASPEDGGPRGYVAAEYLKPAISPDGKAAIGPDDSALRAGQGKFDVTGHLPCARNASQPMTQCDFGVARAGGGYATVVIKYPDGRTRAIFFRMGRPVGADTSQADGYKEFRATKQEDLNLIRVGDERYEIPDAVVLGS